MKHHRTGLLIALMSAVLATGLSPATASSASATGVRKKAPRQAIDRGPAETRAERDKRLARECQGRRNAGACEGYGY
ncbi:MAG: hypothetical protein ACOYB1_02660 [Limnohabitans sp.]